MLFVLTEEPYHENSTVRGVYDNLKDAVKALLDAPNKQTEKDDNLEYVLSSWNANGEERQSAKLAAGSYMLPHLKGKVVRFLRQPGENRWEAWKEIDPLTAEW